MMLNTKRIATNWENEILALTSQINERFPELSKFIEEMPDASGYLSDEDEPNAALKAYHNSLLILLEDYAKTHTGEKKSEKFNNILLSGYRPYALAEDISQKAEEVRAIVPEEISKTKAP